MLWIVRDGLGAFAGAAALALSIASVAPARQVQPDTVPLTEAQTAGVRRLKEMIEVLNSGDYATIRAYFDTRPAGVATRHVCGQTFFEKVTVNAEEPALRENRLKLLSMLRRATLEVADFSRIEG